MNKMRSLIRWSMQPDHLFFAIAAVVVVVWLLSPLVMLLVPAAQRGVAGDQYGAVNSLFAGLAFAGLIATLALQREELKLQRKELRLTRTELEQTRREHAGAREQLTKQTFENTFFEMVHLHHGIVSNMKMGAEITVRECFSRLYQDIRDSHAGHISAVSQSNMRTDVRSYISFLKDFFRKYGHVCGHYFRNLESILVIVDSSQVDDKEFYIDIIKSQLSTFELVMLFYYAASTGHKQLDRIIHDYALFEGLAEDKLISSAHDHGLYDRTAYGVPERDKIDE